MLYHLAVIANAATCTAAQKSLTTNMNQTWVAEFMKQFRLPVKAKRGGARAVLMYKAGKHLFSL